MIGISCTCVLRRRGGSECDGGISDGVGGLFYMGGIGKVDSVMIT